jgi:glycosyltransferase involved in cell wall biosynthesis
MDLISIVLPCFNGQLFIERCIDSLLKQTYSQIEIIVIDDASEDNSAQIISRYKDPRIKLLQNDINLGVGPSRNIGIDASIGKHIYFCDIDDFVEPNYLAELHQGIVGFDCSVGSFKVYSASTSEFIKVANAVYSGDVAKTLGIINGHVGFGLALWNKLFCLNLIRLHNIRFKDIRRSQDSVFALEYFAKVNKVNVVSTKHYYCHCKDNNTSITNTMNEDVVKGYIQISDQFDRQKSLAPKLTNIVLYRQYISQKKSIANSSCSAAEKQAFMKIIERNKQQKKISLGKFVYSLFLVRNFSLKRKLAIMAFVTFDSQYNRLKKLFS